MKKQKDLILNILKEMFLTSDVNNLLIGVI